MKQLLKSIFLILFAISNGCKQEPNEFDSVKPLENEEKLSENQIPKDVDENFETFLKLFSRDSIFQVSRVKFPLKVQEIDIDNTFELTEKIISKTEYTKLDFTYPEDVMTRELDRYSQEIKTKNNTTVIEIRGIDNGIHSD